MDYEKKYKEALETARKINSGEGVAAPKDWSIPEIIFPELKKSEDELIREELINFLEVCEDTRLVANRKREKWISWLMNTKPKFKIGDWVVFDTDGTYQVERIENYEYTLRHTLGGSMPLPFGSQSLLRPWTIQDAKKGDILQANKCTLIFDSLAKDIDGNTVISSWYYCNTKTFYGMGTCKPDLWVINGVTPATKEQHDFLFQQIEKVGHKWDAIKKELIQI